MLKSWSIKNFKPILDSGEIQLAPVTVLAGRNSSGKSSLIQSILMIAQTLSSRVLDRALLPNGPIVQLGTFEDILSEQTDLRTLTVGFELEIGKEKLNNFSFEENFEDANNFDIEEPLEDTSNFDMEEDFENSTNFDVEEPFEDTTNFNEDEEFNEWFAQELNKNVLSVKVTSQFHSAGDNNINNSAIQASKVNVASVLLEIVSLPYGPFGLTSKFSININHLTATELDKFLKGVSSEYLRFIPYPSKDSNYLGIFEVKHELFNAYEPSPVLITFSHFLPSRLLEKYVVEERQKSKLLQSLNLNLRSTGSKLIITSGLSDFNLKLSVSQNSKEAIVNFCLSEGIPEVFSGQTFSDLILWYNSLKIDKEKVKAGNELRNIITQSILEDSLQEDFNNNKKIEVLDALTNNIYADSIEESVDSITRFFTSKIRYLGPLRADPQSGQGFSPTSELDDVGFKGEYAAAVYDANQNAQVIWYDPFEEKKEESTLKDALNTWVSYLGVANEIRTQIAGQSGASWQVVHAKGRKALPLASVGVGVSQVLPILVMGLLAPPNTLLIVEQPELHLHPSVQARLGDFFMGLAKCDKQCLIETHSENLVSQLRYHIVQAGGQEKSDCLIYFVDQDERGAAQFNPIEISAKGNILNWPDGFFDETMLQEDRITAASLKKRATQAHNG